jgi:hypothetical protein
LRYRTEPLSVTCCSDPRLLSTLSLSSTERHSETEAAVATVLSLLFLVGVIFETVVVDETFIFLTWQLTDGADLYFGSPFLEGAFNEALPLKAPATTLVNFLLPSVGGGDETLKKLESLH